MFAGNLNGVETLRLESHPEVSELVVLFVVLEAKLAAAKPIAVGAVIDGPQSLIVFDVLSSLLNVDDCEYVVLFVVVDDDGI